MSREILLLVDVLAREKNVGKEVVFGALELALASASKKRIHDDADVRVSVDRETGDFETFRRWEVVADENYLNENNQVPISEAKEQDPEVEVGDFLVFLGRGSPDPAGRHPPGQNRVEGGARVAAGGIRGKVLWKWTTWMPWARTRASSSRAARPFQSVSRAALQAGILWSSSLCLV